MTSLLYLPPLPRYSPPEGIALKSAEIDAHLATMDMVDQVRESLPTSIKNCCYSATIIGLTTALGRIFADAPNQRQASISVLELSKIVAIEHRYWLNNRTLLH
jgi:hypothetical protein